MFLTVHLSAADTSYNIHNIPQSESRSASTGPAAKNHDHSAWEIRDLEQYALEHNPTIQACRQRIAVLEGRWTQEGLGPNPNVGWTAEEMSSHSGAGKQGIRVSQEIVTRQKLARAQNVVHQEIQVAGEVLESQRLRVLTDVRVAAYEYLAQRRKESLYRELAGLCAEAHAAAESLYKNGEASRVEMLRLGVDAEKMRVAHAASRNSVVAAWRQLACLLGNPEMEPVSVSTSLEMTAVENSWETLSATLLRTSPEIAAAEAEILRAKKSLDLELARNSSNITVDGGVAYSSQDHVFEAGVGVSVPLRIRDRNQGNIAAARSAVNVAQKEYEETVLRVRMRLAEVYRNYLNAKKSASQYRDKILPQAREALHLTESGYRQGELGYLDVLSVQQQYMTIYIEYIDNLNAYWSSMALLEGKLLSGCMEKN